MTRTLALLVLVRAERLADEMYAAFYRAANPDGYSRNYTLAEMLDSAVWESQRLVAGCEKALAGGRPRDPRTGLR